MRGMWTRRKLLNKGEGLLRLDKNLAKQGVNDRLGPLRVRQSALERHRSRPEQCRRDPRCPRPETDSLPEVPDGPLHNRGRTYTS